MDNLVNYMDQDYSILLEAVRCLPMPSSDRDAVTQIISQQCHKIKVTISYSIMFSTIVLFIHLTKKFYSFLKDFLSQLLF